MPDGATAVYERFRLSPVFSKSLHRLLFFPADLPTREKSTTSHLQDQTGAVSLVPSPTFRCKELLILYTSF